MIVPANIAQNLMDSAPAESHIIKCMNMNSLAKPSASTVCPNSGASSEEKVENWLGRQILTVVWTSNPFTESSTRIQHPSPVVEKEFSPTSLRPITFPNIPSLSKKEGENGDAFFT